jgi:hypothetical protein
VRNPLRPEDLVVVDEVGMSSTEDLDRISAIVAAGAKMPIPATTNSSPRSRPAACSSYWCATPKR